MIDKTLECVGCQKVVHGILNYGCKKVCVGYSWSSVSLIIYAIMVIYNTSTFFVLFLLRFVLSFLHHGILFVAGLCRWLDCATKSSLGLATAWATKWFALKLDCVLDQTAIVLIAQIIQSVWFFLSFFFLSFSFSFFGFWFLLFRDFVDLAGFNCFLDISLILFVVSR